MMESRQDEQMGNVASGQEDRGERERGQADLQHDLELGLQQIVPGIRILDRELQLPDGSLVDFLARDASDRLVLVLVVDAQQDHGLLSCLDALAFAQANIELLARHMDAQDLRTDLAPRLILIAAGFDASFLERVRPLLGNTLVLLEVREIRTARGQASYLTPAGTGSTPQEAPIAAEAGQEAPGTGSQARSVSSPDHKAHESRELTDRLLAGMREGERELTGLLIGRMRRLDPGLDVRGGPHGVQWAHAGRLLGSLTIGEGREGEPRPLRTQLSGTEHPVPLTAGRDVDDFIEGIQERYMRAERLRVGVAPRKSSAVGRHPVRSRGTSPAPLPVAGFPQQATQGAQPFAQGTPRGGDPAHLDDDFDEDDLPEFEMQPRDPGVILSPGEIEAFQ